ncbi:MAG TPA: hypothetical protein VEW66_07700 [Thermomicrobiales bacterium]|nr:hypothetical protein [Thermomicrobiales bacterium]
MNILPALPSGVVSAIALRSDAIDYPLESPEVVEAVEQRLAPLSEEFGPMPALQGMISAVNAGAMPLRGKTGSDTVSSDAGAACFRIQYENYAAATQAATVFARRWEKLESPLIGDTYESLMSLEAITVDGSVVSADLTQRELPEVWNEPFRGRDLLPLLADE